MHKTSRAASRRQSQLFLGVLIIGVILLASALWQPVSGEPPGWVAVNDQVKQVLTEQAREKELLAPAPGKKDETIVQASSEKSAEGAEKANGEMSEKASSDSDTGVDRELAEMGSFGGDAAGKLAEKSSAAGDAAGKLAEKSSAAVDAAGKLPADVGSKLDINKATAEQLDALPGIGAVKAQTIVADREKNGVFRSVDDLLRVKGIGPKLLEKMKASIVAGP